MALEIFVRYRRYLKSESTFIDFSKWFDRSVEVGSVGIDEIKKSIRKAVICYGFKITKDEDDDSFTTIEAIRGQRFWSAIERHGEHGKRLIFSATFKHSTPVELRFTVNPLMELFDRPEEPGLSQDGKEKYFDDLASAEIFNKLTKNIFEYLKRPIPEDLKEFNSELAAKYIFIRSLVYPPLDIKKASGIFLPPYGVPRWNWKAFIIPEVWYVWNSVGSTLGIIAGCGTLFLALMLLASNVSLSLRILSVLVFFASRVLSGRSANLMYFARHGKVPKEKGDGRTCRSS